MIHEDTVPARESLHQPPPTIAELAHPRPEAEKPPLTAETAINRALGADTRSGSSNGVGKSDDAPFIYAEINKLSHQFGRLEKEVELSTAELRRQATTLHEVHVDTKNLCDKHGQLQRDILGIAPSVTQTVSGLLATLKTEVCSQINHVDNKLPQIISDISTSTAAVNQLKTDQAKVVGGVQALTPIIKKSGWFLGVFILGLFTAGSLFWTQSMRPSLVKDISEEVQKAVHKELQYKEALEQIEQLKSANAALQKNAKR